MKNYFYSWAKLPVIFLEHADSFSFYYSTVTHLSLLIAIIVALKCSLHAIFHRRFLIYQIHISHVLLIPPHLQFTCNFYIDKHCQLFLTSAEHSVIISALKASKQYIGCKCCYPKRQSTTHYRASDHIRLCFSYIGKSDNIFVCVEQCSTVTSVTYTASKISGPS